MEKEKSELQSKESKASKASKPVNWEEDLVFLFSKNMEQWLAPYMGYTIGVPIFLKQYFWYILYLVVWVVIFSNQNLKYNFTREEFGWGFGGLVLGGAMMFLFGLYDNNLIPVEAISQSNIVITPRDTNVTYNSTPYKKSLNNNKLISNSEQHSFAYLYSKEKIKNIKTIDLTTWIEQSSDQAKNSGPDTNVLAPFDKIEENGVTHNKIIMVVMVTFISILVKWEKRIFNRMIPWILIILFFEIITVALRLQDSTVRELNNSLFISKKIHQLVSCWSMALILLFIGFYHTFK
jgi:hypothetical protein